MKNHYGRWDLAPAGPRCTLLLPNCCLQVDCTVQARRPLLQVRPRNHAATGHTKAAAYRWCSRRHADRDARRNDFVFESQNSDVRDCAAFLSVVRLQSAVPATTPPEK